MEVTNGGGSSITVTVPSYPTVRGQAVADRAVTVAASATKKIPIYADLNTNPAERAGRARLLHHHLGDRRRLPHLN